MTIERENFFAQKYGLWPLQTYTVCILLHLMMFPNSFIRLGFVPGNILVELPGSEHWFPISSSVRTPFKLGFPLTQ